MHTSLREIGSPMCCADGWIPTLSMVRKLGVSMKNQRMLSVLFYGAVFWAGVKVQDFLKL